MSEPAAAQMPPALDEYIARAMRDWQVPGVAIVIVKDDQVVATKGYGVRELGKPDLVDGETLFDIASLTKSFTAAGAAVLVDAGTLRWDDKVHEGLPSVTFGDACIDQEVTLRDLLSHRTGLQPANALFGFFGFDRIEILNAVRFLQPQRPFRTEMLYSNVLYAVAGDMTAAAAKTPWAELVRERVVKPAGMMFTAVEVRPTGNVASPHAFIGGKQQPIQPSDFTMVAPSASIHSNAVDMARWLRLQLNDGVIDGTQVISRASMIEMHSPQTIIHTTPEMRAGRNVEFFGGYGLGWQIMDYRGEPIVWHTGNSNGMPSYMAILPRKELGVCVMMNTWGAGFLHGMLANKIIDAYVDAPETDWSGDGLARHRKALEDEAEDRKRVATELAAAKKPRYPLKDYAGTYHADLWGGIHIRLDGDQLTFQGNDGDKATLVCVGDNVFHLEWEDVVWREVFYDTRVTIHPGSPGKLEMTLNRDRIEATRQP